VVVAELAAAVWLVVAEPDDQLCLVVAAAVIRQ
jgi:hypothetical protein